MLGTLAAWMRPAYSPTEPVSLVRHVPIRECGEPMVDFTTYCPSLLLDEPRFNYTRATYVRQTVGDMLNLASKALPKQYRLAIIEGWRPKYIQRRMYLAVWDMVKTRHPEWSDTQLKRLVNRNTAPVDTPRVPPPHLSGGAVDVMLAHPDGRLLDHREPYEWHDYHCFPLDAPNLGPEARRVRTILADALLTGGLTNYPSEFWHWSYGDQGWAFRTGADAAIYGPTEPDGWCPIAEDAIDEPLTWVYEPK